MFGGKELDMVPPFSVNAGPDSKDWPARLREELLGLIEYVRLSKENDAEWFRVECDKEGRKWQGSCWYVHEFVRHEFKLEFEIPAAYPACPIELVLPELDGTTPKMYRGGKICQDIHFAPLWLKSTPRLGIVHALALSLAPWLAAEVPELVHKGVLKEG